LETSIHEEDNRSTEVSEKSIDKNEIALVKKASRAFAVSYVNEIYNTIKSLDPSSLERFEITRQYPYYFYLFIHQEKPGEIERLDIYSEQKYYRDGVCEVREIYHSSEFESSYIEEKKGNIAKRCENWQLTSIEVPKMYMIARYGGKRVGKSIYNFFKSPLRRNIKNNSFR
jgi:hypothetical protein